MKRNYCRKWGKLLRGGISLSLTAAMLFTGASTAFACTGVYVGSDFSENGSAYVGRSEDIGKLYDKVFEIIPAADHASGELYKDEYGFSMPYPAHTYRYTIMRDSVEAGETVMDGEKILAEAYGEAGVNEKGVAVSATVSTDCNDDVMDSDPIVYYEEKEGALHEISLAQVVLMQAKTAKDGVEKLAAILDQYGAGECNQLSISDKNEVWDFEILSGHQYAAVRMKANEVAINPNMLGTVELDVNDTQNVVASKDLISLPFEHEFLVSSQLTENPEIALGDIHKIDIGSTYTTRDHGAGQYVRYWQGVNYLNPALAADIEVGTKERKGVEGMYIDPVYTPMRFTADKRVNTYEVLRFLAYRGEGSEYDHNKGSATYSIGNERQAECHIFEIRQSMPDALSVIQWQAMSRAEFSIYLPFYSNLLTDTSGIYKTEYLPNAADIEDVLDDTDFPDDTSMYWVCAAINDLCDNDRDRYGENVKLFWKNYQNRLIEQQQNVDDSMKRIYVYSPALAETKATALGKAVSEEAFGYAKTILTELRRFIADHPSDEEIFIPSVLTENKLPSYSIDMVGGTGIPSGGKKHSSSSSKAVDNTVKEEKPAVNPGNETAADKSATAKFSDVKKSSWFAEAVQFVMDKGIMNGVSENSFGANQKTNRAMVVTMLYRLEGEPKASAAGFADVKSGQYYEGAVNWASGNSIVSGIGENAFNPSGDLTREQLASILYRYAQYKKIDVSKSGQLSGFGDHAQISSYANESMAWAVGNGIINGKDGKLAPKDTTTRAEVAAMFQRMNDILK
ncbi:hypothetical protein Ami103574_14120 [Aminipila butyrica]|uniref:SLH domain-containing protein n=1 Tax=Aminipila butyrica TaxID=433296 RepID=A0A858BYZ2_9FIRM|nr:C69 family dipeptidase [Aminipila butyrica]QIB70355.1 hypothetical protein Ami103574_14120 [Aminipila butyrica]